MSEEIASGTDLYEIMRTTRSMRRLIPFRVPNELIRKPCLRGYQSFRWSKAECRVSPMPPLLLTRTRLVPS
jgi:hypothetical protein